MEIHIDTRRDSDEEIRKTIKFLQSLIGDEQNTPSESSAPTGSFNMFGNESNSSGDSSPAPMNMFGSDDDAPSDYSPDEKVESEDAVIEIVEY